MVFSSLLFLFFYLPATLLVYYLVPSKWRNLWLFLVNLVFYGWEEKLYVLLMLFSIAVNYAAGILVEKHRDKGRRILAVNAVINLGLLFFFKYYDFLAVNLGRLPLFSFMHPLGIALPIGISFYTFQNMSYPIDVYRGDARSQPSFIRYGTYVALFPQLIAGPIVRYKDIALQLEDRTETRERFASGVCRFCVGLSKKVLLANNIGALWDVYKTMDPAALSFADAWLGALAFTFQIYFDFSGYSDMAVGLGRMLGFEFVENFNYPYISRSITEFWRRWHISLNRWFVDYLYIPLGGSRRGKWTTLRNRMLVFLATGVWHGAGWTFILWGLWNGLFVSLEGLFPGAVRAEGKAPLRRVLLHIYALLVFLTGFMMFRAANVQQGLLLIGRLFSFSASSTAALVSLRTLLTASRCFFLLLGLLFAMPLAPLLRRLAAQRLGEISSSLELLGNALALVGLVLAVAAMAGGAYSPFIYQQF